MLVDIQQGLENALYFAAKQSEKARLFLYYNDETKSVSGSLSSKETEMGLCVGYYNRNLMADEALNLVEAAYKINLLETMPVAPDNIISFDGTMVESVYKELGFSDENWQSFVMGCYLWSADCRKSKISRLYLGEDGHAYVQEEENYNPLWFRSIDGKRSPVHYGLTLSKTYYTQSVFIVAGMMLEAYRLKREAYLLEAQILAVNN